MNRPVRRPCSSFLAKFQALTDRSLLLALGVIALLIDGAGIFLQYSLNLAPCPLCIFQRFLFLLIAATALSSAALPLPRLHRLTGFAILPMVLAGLGTTIYQSWIQAFPEDAGSACGFADPTTLELFVEWLGNVHSGLFLASGLCTNKSWEWLGLSMANWSLVTFLLITTAVVIRLIYPHSTVR